MMGYSSGGHLTLSVATMSDDGNPVSNDPVKRTSSAIAAAVARPEPLNEPAPMPMPMPPAPKERASGPSCNWPIGDPGDADFRFCGQPASSGKPYCAEHCAKAYISRSRSSESEAA